MAALVHAVPVGADLQLVSDAGTAGRSVVILIVVCGVIVAFGATVGAAGELELDADAPVDGAAGVLAEMEADGDAVGDVDEPGWAAAPELSESPFSVAADSWTRRRLPESSTNPADCGSAT